jgi:hypothetical protein
VIDPLILRTDPERIRESQRRRGEDETSWIDSSKPTNARVI